MTRADLRRATVVAAAAVAIGHASLLTAQGRGGQPPAPPPSARAAAPVDLTGYWVSYVSKEWRFRMVTPAKGDIVGAFGGIPLRPDARRVAEAWDPARDAAAGEACKAYGAAGLMRIPGRLRITWQDDNTLRVDTDAGMQTRLFRFTAEAPASQGPTWQGHSTARWALPTVRGRVAALAATPRGGVGAQPGKLDVVTTNLRPGYLRRNGVPYSEQTVMTEHWDVFKEPDGTDWLVITTAIEDPRYLQMPYLTSPAFKRERDGAKWDPSPCSAE
jgi:hypothetical protein